MPRGDGRGPAGPGFGQGANRNNAPKGGRGRNQGPLQAGPAGDCVCPNCQKRMPHNRSMPCNTIKCPDCGTLMTRA